MTEDKIPTNSHRADRYELGAESRPPQCGSPAWVRSLAETPLRPCAAALQRMTPAHFTEEFVRDNGFTRPVIFHTSEGLDMQVPNANTFNVRSVLRYCGAQHEVEVIDVRKQSTLRMPLSEFVAYFESAPPLRQDKVLNVLSLEFSDTSLAPLVSPPAVLSRLDWSTRVWPAAEPRPPRPAVQKYCLLSAAGSYTDFHVDFGGTTVWYHVMQGQKIFYLVPPTSTNLALYQQWSASPTQSEQFFGDLVEWYGTAELCAGQTLFIPSGWIHAVLTPRDSLVFGGNLLHSYAVEMQLQIYEIERRVETPLMFRYPLFEAMNWYAGAHLLTMLRRHNEETQDEEFTLGESGGAPAPALPPLLLRGVKILANALKEWHALKATDPQKRDNVPKCLNSGQLVRELCKELRTLEKRSHTTASKDKDFKPKTNSPTKQVKKQPTPAKKSLKLTLPKPIMHNMGNGEYEEKIYTDRYFIDDKEVYPERYDEKYPVEEKYIDGKYPVDEKYIDGKYPVDEKYVVDINGKYIVDGNGKFMEDNSGKYVVNNTKYVVNNGKYLVEKEVKDYVYQSFEETQYQPAFVEREKKPTVLKIKLNPPSPREEPPPYPAGHSILKSHLVRPRLNHQQWTISKKEGEYQQVLYTNDQLQAVRNDDPAYGPGMYSNEDVQPEYQYAEGAKTSAYPHEYGFTTDVAYGYSRYDDAPPIVHQNVAYTQPATESVPTYGQPPPYVAPSTLTYTNSDVQQDTGYVIEEQKPPTHTPVRRSERPVRRRVSNTYDYEDSDLYIDDTPPPARRRKHKQHYRNTNNTNSSSSAVGGYRQSAPANGIESLIQASVIADEQPVNDTEDAAVAGMLSIGEQRYTPRFGLANTETTQANSTENSTSTSSPTSGTKRPRKPTLSATLKEDYDDEEDVIKEVHRDEEYVYPSLEMSSDDDEEWSTARRRRPARARVDKTRTDKDESWSPRARLGRLVPRLRGPARAGVRRECVRAALHAAAAATHTQSTKRVVVPPKRRPPPPPVHNTPKTNNNIRLKKGMKTAKQRLGKILKIHKMIY